MSNHASKTQYHYLDQSADWPLGEGPGAARAQTDEWPAVGSCDETSVGAIAAVVRVALVCRQAEARAAYRARLEAAGAEVTLVTRLGALSDALASEAHHGIVMDVPTQLKASAEEREATREVLELYPVLSVRYQAKSDTVRAFSTRQSKVSGEEIEDFLFEECAGHTPRRARAFERHTLRLNLTLSRTGNFSQDDSSRAVTADVSAGGCFAVTMDDWNDTDEVFVLIRELASDIPIRCRIRWTSAWGEGSRFPGLGLSFEDIEPLQREELLGWLSGRRLPLSSGVFHRSV